MIKRVVLVARGAYDVDMALQKHQFFIACLHSVKRLIQVLRPSDLGVCSVVMPVILTSG
jgi:hypothetical protein